MIASPLPAKITAAPRTISNGVFITTSLWAPENCRLCWPIALDMNER